MLDNPRIGYRFDAGWDWFMVKKYLSDNPRIDNIFSAAWVILSPSALLIYWAVEGSEQSTKPCTDADQLLSKCSQRRRLRLTTQHLTTSSD